MRRVDCEESGWVKEAPIKSCPGSLIYMPMNKESRINAPPSQLIDVSVFFWLLVDSNHPMTRRSTLGLQSYGKDMVSIYNAILQVFATCLIPKGIHIICSSPNTAACNTFQHSIKHVFRKNRRQDVLKSTRTWKWVTNLMACIQKREEETCHMEARPLEFAEFTRSWYTCIQMKINC